MDLTCPSCNQKLPEVETLKYRFCPHCGAEIDTKPRRLDEAFLTIPPDLPPIAVDAKPKDPGLAPERTTPENGQFNDQTIAPQPITPEKRPHIRPPAEPPPPGFFRTLPSENDPPPSIPKKQLKKKADPPLTKPIKKPPTKNHHKVIIAVLIILAVVILILGWLFTF